jgi:hypothetical protein
VRLTLRTLLAYLDDTLEPTEIKTIGHKVSESDTAQELIARIKQITRRRRLTTPPATGPNSFDPNTVAEYLDNELPAEKTADVEKLCLESDVHLAEIATCHQILTLVLGEPALVPPTAKERMYGLVHGREAIPFRKANAPAGAIASAPGHHDADEMLLLGLPFYRRGTWLRWALPVAAVLLVAGLAVALWQALRGSGTPDPDKRAVANAGTNSPEKNETPRDNGNAKKPPIHEISDPVKKDGKDDKDSKPADDSAKPPRPQEDEPKRGAAGRPEPDKKGPDSTKAGQPARNTPPSNERALLGKSYRKPNDLPSILVRNTPQGWKWVRPGEQVYSTEPLVSLPGSRSEVRLDSDVHLVLRGLLPEFSRHAVMDFLLESAAVLHKNPDFDLDATLQRGRFYLSNHKGSGPAKVRLRFGPAAEPEVWDLTLGEGSEVGIDLTKRCTQDVNYLEGEEPDMVLVLQVLNGKSGLRIDANHYPNLTAPPGPSLVVWDYKSGKVEGPIAIDKKSPNWLEAPPSTTDARDMQTAVKELSGRMDAAKSPVLVVEESLGNERPVDRFLAIYCLEAMDQVPRLLNVLGEQDPNRWMDREKVIFALRCWLGHDGEQSRKLYDPSKKTGVLTSMQKFKRTEADALAMLLHDFTEEAKRSEVTYDLLSQYLLSEKVAIAEMAFYHLRRLARGYELPPFNAAWPRDLRQPVAEKVDSLLKAGKLPPPERGPGGGPPGGSPPPVLPKKS